MISDLTIIGGDRSVLHVARSAERRKAGGSGEHHFWVKWPGLDPGRCILSEQPGSGCGTPVTAVGPRANSLSVGNVVLRNRGFDGVWGSGKLDGLPRRTVRFRIVGWWVSVS